MTTTTQGYYYQTESPSGTIGDEHHHDRDLDESFLEDQDDQGLHEEHLCSGEAELSRTSNSSNSSTQQQQQQHLLGLWQLVVLVFYEVSGGPFGMEEAVRSAGPFWTIVGFVLGPFIWSIPEALVTAELGAAFPEASGGVVWVEEAFDSGGEWAGWMCGFLNYISGATDNAIYPVLFLQYVHAFLQQMTTTTMTSGGADDDDTDALSSSSSSWLQVALVSGTSIVLAYINYRGLPLVGNMSIAICIFSMTPFVVFIIMGIPHVDVSKWMVMERPSASIAMNDADDNEASGFLQSITMTGILWRPFLNNLFWNLNSYDSAANFAGDVRNVGQIFPKGMILSVGIMVVSYLLPLLIALGVDHTSSSEDSKHYSSSSSLLPWNDGYLVTIAMQIGGAWLGGWIVLAAGISNLGLFQAEMSSDALQLLGMAERGYLPEVFATRSPRYHTPTYGILTGLLLILILSNVTSSNLAALIDMLNVCYALALLMEYAAFVKLRISKPTQVERPFRIPLNTVGCILMLTPAVLGLLIIILLADTASILYALLAVGVGFALYSIRRRRQATSTSTTTDSSTQDTTRVRRQRSGEIMRHQSSAQEEEQGRFNDTDDFLSPDDDDDDDDDDSHLQSNRGILLSSSSSSLPPAVLRHEII